MKQIRDVEMVAGVARPPRAVLPLGDERVQRRTWQGPRALCFHGGTARQPTRGLDSAVALCRTMSTVAAAPRRRVLHGGGLLGAGLSVSLVSSIGAGLCLGGDYTCRRRWLVVTGWFCSVGIALWT